MNATEDSPAVSPTGAEVGGTPTRILDLAQQLIQTRGFSGFSYADIAADLQISKPAVHYHFASKNEMGLAVAHRYRMDFLAALAGIGGHTQDMDQRLTAYAGLFVTAMRSGRICLGGALAAEAQTLPEVIRTEVATFFADNVAWLADTLAAGGVAPVDAVRRAEVLLSGLEGAMLMARSAGGAEWFAGVAAGIVAAAVADV